MTAPINDFRRSKKGDKVTCCIYGKGIIDKISQESRSKYPVYVEFNDEYYQYYTLDGKLDEYFPASQLYKGHLLFECAWPLVEE